MRKQQDKQTKENVQGINGGGGWGWGGGVMHRRGSKFLIILLQSAEIHFYGFSVPSFVHSAVVELSQDTANDRLSPLVCSRKTKRDDTD